MQRNLDHRIEVVVPVEAPNVRAEIETIFRALLTDNSQAWSLSGDGTWERVRPPKGERRRPAQVVAMRRHARGRHSEPHDRRERRRPVARHDGDVPVGVIDVGSNTVRLHVARDGATLYREKAMLRLGESIERFGSIPETKLAETASCVAGFVQQARRLGVSRSRCSSRAGPPGREGRELSTGWLRQRVFRPAPLLGRRGAACVRRRRHHGDAHHSHRAPPDRRRRRRRRLGAGRRWHTSRWPGWVRSIDNRLDAPDEPLPQRRPTGDVAVQAARTAVDKLLEGVVPRSPRAPSQSAAAPGRSARCWV